MVIRSTSLVDVVTGTVRPRTTIIVRGDQIEDIGSDAALSIPEDAQVVDGSDSWAVPGLIDVHSHTTEPEILRGSLALGVTSALTIYLSEPAPEIGLWSVAPENPTPSLYIVAGRFSAEFPGRVVPEAVMRSPRNGEAARAAVAEMEGQGFRSIKIWQDDGTLLLGEDGRMETLTQDVLEALIDQAHSREMRVYVHAWHRRYYRQIVELRPDWLIHPFIDLPAEQADVQLLRDAGIGWTPTITSLLWTADPRAYARRVLSDSRLAEALTSQELGLRQADAEADQNPALLRVPAAARSLDRYLEVLRRNTLTFVENQIPLSVGSDLPPGTGTHIEIELMAEFGIDPPVILKAATLGGAMTLGIEGDVGTLEIGKRADIVLLDSNPLQDVRNLRDVRAVIKGGRVWFPSELL